MKCINYHAVGYVDVVNDKLKRYEHYYLYMQRLAKPILHKTICDANVIRPLHIDLDRARPTKISRNENKNS